MGKYISDLVSYLQYNNFDVLESSIYSVFDYLYEQYTDARLDYLKGKRRISEYDSENLMYSLITDTLKADGYVELRVVCHLPLNMLIRDPKLLDEDEVKYAMNPATHLDFLIYNRISKRALLAIEVDGYSFHKDGKRQAERDRMKNDILKKYQLPLIRFSTTGSREKERLSEALKCCVP